MSTRRKAFTLPELLVEIGIIAVLVAMLLPALSKARDYARTVKCTTQLQQFGAATQFYVNDYKGMLFPCYYAGNGALGASASGLDQILSSYVSRVDPATTLWVCPSAEIRGNQFPLTYACNEGVHPWYGYDGSNLPAVWMDAAGIQYRTLKKINQFPRPTETVTIGDASQGSGAGTSTGWFDYTDTRWSEMNQISQANQLMKTVSNWGVNIDVPGAGGVRYRHARETVGNVLFLDGHVESFYLFTLLKRNFATGY